MNRNIKGLGYLAKSTGETILFLAFFPLILVFGVLIECYVGWNEFVNDKVGKKALK